MQREFLIAACSIIFILPMCFSVRIDFLKYVSPVGVLAIVYVVSLIAYEYFHGDYVPGPIKQHPDKWTDVFLVVPVICFGYQVIYRRLHKKIAIRNKITVYFFNASCFSFHNLFNT